MNWRDRIKTNPAALKMPRMSEADRSELQADILVHGVLQPIEFFVDAEKTVTLIDGISRLDALEAAGIELIDDKDDHLIEGYRRNGKEFRLEWHHNYARDGHDPDALVASFNLIRRHLTPEQRREYRAAYIAAHPEFSDRKIAADLAVHHTTIGGDRRRVSNITTGGFPPVAPKALISNDSASTTTNATVASKPLISTPAVTRIGRDGKTRRLPQSKRATRRVPTPAVKSASTIQAVKPSATIIEMPRQAEKPTPARLPCHWVDCEETHEYGHLPTDWGHLTFWHRGTERYPAFCPKHSAALLALLRKREEDLDEALQ